jgi:hypothetical protein
MAEERRKVSAPEAPRELRNQSFNQSRPFSRAFRNRLLSFPRIKFYGNLFPYCKPRSDLPQIKLMADKELAEVRRKARAQEARQENRN